MKTAAPTRPRSWLRDFLATEAAGGLVLMAAAALALVVANSPLATAYFGAKAAYLGPLTVDYWINDGLMAIFFLVVGLEIKREFLDGQLATPSRRVLPGLAAVAGAGVPALVYLLFASDPATRGGWAIPAATDIAFALGVLALLGSRVPASLKVFLTAVAILDDIGAVAIIALFYTSELALAPLGGAAALTALLVAFNRGGVRALWPYLAVGVAVWVLVLQSGVHATLAGVAVALTVPLDASPGRPASTASPLHRLEHVLHPWVAFVVVPVFGFANAGVSFAGLGLGALLAPVPLGIAAGLFLGKQLGIFAAVWAAVRLGLADLPMHATWRHMYGVALLCGIGFTMSLFIGGLAFEDPALDDQVKLGVLAGSLLAGGLGYAVLAGARARDC